MNYKTNTHFTMCKLTILSTIIFAICFILAMLFYPGGTQLDTNIRGYSFFSNFFSDTGRITSYSGESNIISMIFFAIALILTNVCLIFFHFENIQFYKHKNKFNSLRNVAGISGIISAITAIFIPIFPEDIYPTAHMIVTLTFSNLLLFMLIFYAIIIKKETNYSDDIFRLIMIYVIFLILYLSLIMTNILGFNEDISLSLKATGQKIAIIYGFFCIASLAYGMQKRITT